MIQKNLFVTIAGLIFLCMNLPASAQLSGWKYKRKIQINNVGGNALNNYQVPIVIDGSALIVAGKMKSDASDIRFTDSTGTVFLPYWLETSANNTQAKIWVKLPSIPASGMYTINLAYGNDTAAAVSNGNNVFELFDDFSQTTLDKNKWTIKEGRNYPTYHSINNGIIRVYGEKSSFNPGAFLVSKKSTDLTDKILETRMATYDNGIKSQYIALYADTNFYPASGQFLLANRPGYTNAFTKNHLGVNGSWVTMGTQYPLPMEYNKVSLLVTSDFIRSTFKGESVTTTQRPTSSNGFLYFGAADDYSGTDGGLLIDYIFLRAYTAIEPQHTVGTETLNTSFVDENRTESNFHIFPNPANDEVQVILEKALLAGNESIKIYNFLGQSVMQQKIIPGSWRISMDVTSLPSGVYIVNIGRKNVKLIKN